MPNKHPVNYMPWLIIVAAIIICTTWSVMALEQVVSDEEYYERCQAPQFGGRPPECEFLRPESAPLDCGWPDFSPVHPFCTREQTDKDIRARCDGFGPPPSGCQRPT